MEKRRIFVDNCGFLGTTCGESHSSKIIAKSYTPTHEQPKGEKYTTKQLKYFLKKTIIKGKLEL